MGSNPFLSSPSIPTNPKSTSAAVGYWQRLALSGRAITAPKPPWLVPSPARRSASSGGIELAHSSLNSIPNGRMPISLRLVQLQKKSLARRQRPKDPSALCPIGGSVWSLICLLEELNKSAVYFADESNQDRVFWDSTEPLIWLFLRLFSTSPNLLSSILGLTAGFIGRSVDKCVVEMVSSAFNFKMEPAVLELEVSGKRMDAAGAAVVGAAGKSLGIGKYCSWADIGILEDPERVVIDSRRLDHRRRRSHYESMIVREMQPNSLILSNYAQYLYQFEGDLERAQEYFKLSLMTEPLDGEAANKYAKFLWHERGDLAGAEEMFLDAIEADPTSSYYQSSYANFLLRTGGDETCFLLDMKNNA